MKRTKFGKDNYENHLARNLKDREFREGFLMESQAVKLALDLSRARENRHLTQSQLAHRIGMKQQVISRIEQGSQNTTLETIFRVAAGVGKRVKITLV